MQDKAFDHIDAVHQGILMKEPNSFNRRHFLPIIIIIVMIPNKKLCFLNSKADIDFTFCIFEEISDMMLLD